MSKFDSFFESLPDKKVTDDIVKSAEVELANNRVRESRKKLLWLVPLTTAFAGLFLFNFNLSSHGDKSEPITENEDQLNMTAQLMEDDDMLDMLASIEILEDLEFLDSDENLEEG